MATQLFRVDLSNGAPDYQPKATEPGLAMLDRTGANYTILRQWLGDVVAEPEWESNEVVHFYVREETRGRLDQVECEPVNRWDLQGHLKEPFEEIATKIRRVKPGSTTEQTLHRIVSEMMRSLTSDLDASDYDSYFFKYREGREPWKLLFCWGYQRADLQPGRALLCDDQKCQQLYVHREKSKPVCPGCQKPTRKRSTAGRLPRIPTSVWILLLLGLGLFGYFYRPRLEASPAAWQGRAGSQVAFQVMNRRWLFFDQDVTAQVVAQSHDRRVVEFRSSRPEAVARRPGRTQVSLRYHDRVLDVPIEVGPPEQPDSMTIEPAKAQIAIGSTVDLTVWGNYSDGKPNDLTEMVTLEVADRAIAVAGRGRLEGVAEGQTKVTARFQAGVDSPAVEAQTEVAVARADFKSLEVELRPLSLKRGQQAALTVNALDANGNRYSMLGSSLLKLRVEPETAADLQADHLLAQAEGPATLTAQVGELNQAFQFMVSAGSLLADGTFLVTPSQLNLAVDEYYTLDVLAASDAAIETVSSDPQVVEVMSDRAIVGRGPGAAVVTLRQDGQERQVAVEVTPLEIERLAIVPAQIRVPVGQIESFRIVGTGPDGQQIDLAPSRIEWVKQPLATDADLNRDTLQLFGIQTTDNPHTLAVKFGENLVAEATVEVVGPPTTTVVTLDDEFLVYPPIGGGTVVGPTYLGDGLTFSSGGGLVVGDVLAGTPLAVAGIPSGAIITGADGIRFEGSPVAQLKEYLAGNPIGPGTVLQYRLPGDDELHIVQLNEARGVSPVRLVEVRARNVSATEFSAELTLELREEGEYRLVDGQGKPLSERQHLGPLVTATMLTTSLPRSADREYDVWVERQIGETIKKFQITFKLETDGP